MLKKNYLNNFFYPLVENPYSDSDIKEGIKILKSKQLTISDKTQFVKKCMLEYGYTILR